MSEIETHQYIFEKEAGDQFYDFLENFHESFVGDMIMTGTGKIDQHIEDVKMVTLDSEKSLCEQILGGMLRHDPFMHICYADHIICNVYALDNKTNVNGVYMSQQVKNYPRENYCLWSFWICDSDLSIVSDIL